MDRRNGIILSYGFFLGWLLSFPFSGPVLEKATAGKLGSPAVLALVYVFLPVLFLAVYARLELPEARLRRLMLLSTAVSLAGTLAMGLVTNRYWYAMMGLMGIASVVFITAWGFFYTRYIPMRQKMKTMAQVIICGNVIFGLVNAATHFLDSIPLLLLVSACLAVSLWASIRLPTDGKLEPFDSPGGFPTLLVVTLCIVMFIVNLNGGIMFQVVYPFFRQYHSHALFYTALPYIGALLLYCRFEKQVSKTLPLYIGTSLIGIAYIAFALGGKSLTGYYLTETIAQSAWALIDLFLWTLVGEIASIYGHPVRICSYALMADLSSVFFGGVIGLHLVRSGGNYLITAALLAAAVAFVAMLFTFWLNNRVEHDLVKQISLPAVEAPIGPEQINSKQKSPASSVFTGIAAYGTLTAREKEVAGLLAKGLENKAIAGLLHISENTLKIHARHIYAKLDVSNRKELLHLLINANSSKDRKIFLIN